MADIEVKPEALVIHIRGIDKLLSFASQFTLPRTHVKGVQAGIHESAQAQLDQSVRLPGAYMPGIAIAGRFYEHGNWAFWDIHTGEKAITLEVEHEKYTRFVVEVDEPERTVAAIRAWMATN
jgi:hypothetical protein